MTREGPLQVIAVVGPTASGKTGLAIELAGHFGTEIISADSMQVYRGMEIGTAAPTHEEQVRVKHHFVGFLNPDEQFSAGAFGQAARKVVAALNEQGKPAVVAGGSGLYVRALIDGLFDGPGRDEAVRKRLHEEAEHVGVEELYKRLRELDPDYAAVILPGDLRRVVRALEVYEVSGEPMSRLHEEHREENAPLGAVQFAIDLPREILYARIDARVDKMLEAGFVQEVRRLMGQGYGDRLRELRTLGYPEFAAHLEGELSYEDAVERMKRNTRRFARRQLSWFRPDKRIRWIESSGDEGAEALGQRVLAWMEEGDNPFMSS